MTFRNSYSRTNEGDGWRKLTLKSDSGVAEFIIINSAILSVGNV